MPQQAAAQHPHRLTQTAIDRRLHTQHRTGGHGLAHDPIHAEEKQIVGIAVVGAHAHALGVRTELGDRLDRLRQRVPGRERVAADVEGDQLTVGVEHVDRHEDVGVVGGNLATGGTLTVTDRAALDSCIDRHTRRFAALGTWDRHTDIAVMPAS